VKTPNPDELKRTLIRRILLLDDEQAILIPMSRYFSKLGFTVDMAREAEEAEALISHRRYDCAILDLRLTKFSDAAGLDVLREIRKRDHHTSVIILSAYASEAAQEEAVRLGADAVLRKPQPLPELAQLALALMGASL
jgi:two-component system copper resistance phosphate regulon response regulator CusR